MQNENVREQPFSGDLNQLPEVEQNEQLVVGNNKLQEGSLLGKFKDIKSLADAYANLQSEFTRKSQKLSEYEKSDNLLKSTKLINNEASAASNNYISDNSQKLSKIANQKSNSANNSKTGGELSNDIDNVGNATKIVENNFDNSLEYNSNNELFENSEDSKTSLDNDDNKPQKLKTSIWQEQVDEFLKKHPTAKSFANSIVEEIYNDPSLSNNNKSLEVAYSRVLAKKYKPESELVTDDEFLNKHIFNNKKITQKIVLDYLNGLKNSNTPPVIVSSKGAHLGAGLLEKPQNLNEAKAIFEKMLKKQ